MSEEILLPAIGEDEAPFWEAARAEELRIQQCASCERLRFPPRPMCPWCRDTDARWALMSGRGTIYSFVVPHPPLLPQFQALAPYGVILVALDEDPTIRLVGNLVRRVGDPIDAVDPGEIEIGAPVRVVFDPITEDLNMPRWIQAS